MDELASSGEQIPHIDRECTKVVGDTLYERYELLQLPEGVQRRIRSPWPNHHGHDRVGALAVLMHDMHLNRIMGALLEGVFAGRVEMELLDLKGVAIDDQGAARGVRHLYRMTIIQDIERRGIIVELENGRIASGNRRRGEIDGGLRHPRAARFPVRAEAAPEGGAGVAFVAKRDAFARGGEAVMSPVTS